MTAQPPSSSTQRPQEGQAGHLLSFASCLKRTSFISCSFNLITPITSMPFNPTLKAEVFATIWTLWFLRSSTTFIHNQFWTNPIRARGSTPLQNVSLAQKIRPFHKQSWRDDDRLPGDRVQKVSTFQSRAFYICCTVVQDFWILCIWQCIFGKKECAQ